MVGPMVPVYTTISSGPILWLYTTIILSVSANGREPSFDMHLSPKDSGFKCALLLIADCAKPILCTLPWFDADGKLPSFNPCSTDKTCPSVPVMFSCRLCMLICSCCKLLIALVRPIMVFCMFIWEYILMLLGKLAVFLLAQEPFS